MEDKLKERFKPRKTRSDSEQPEEYTEAKIRKVDADGLESPKRGMDQLSEGIPKAKRQKSESTDSTRNDDWIKGLIESISKRSPPADVKPPNMELPELYEGSDVFKFRSWWSVKRYMKVYEPSIRRDDIMIT